MHPHIPLAALWTVLATRADQPFDTAVIEREVRALYATGRFADVRATAVEETGGRRVTFQVVETPRLFLRAVRTQPAHFRLEAQVPAGTPVDAVRAHTIASQFRVRLAERGFAEAAVVPEIIPLAGAQADLVLHVTAHSQVKIAAVTLSGGDALERKQIDRAFTRLWNKNTAYSPQAVDSAAVAATSLYLSRGYFDATVRKDHTSVSNDRAAIGLLATPGARYRVGSWQVSGEGIDTERTLTPTGFDARAFCGCLLRARRDAEKQGILDFNVRLSTVAAGAGHAVDLAATIERGRPYRIRRIDLFGNHKFSDRTVRANLLLRESDPLDWTVLRKSLDRLNRSSLFEPLDETSVDVSTDPHTGQADVRIRLKERKFGSWMLSGPVGPMSLAGPLHFALAARLPPWGQGLLELSTWSASFNVFGYADPLAHLLGKGSAAASAARVRPIVALQRPYIPGQGWTSGITFAPQIGWRGMLLQYGSTQIRERTLGTWLSVPERGSPLAVTVERPHGNGTLLCQPPPPKLARLRRGAALALRLAAAFPLL